MSLRRDWLVGINGTQYLLLFTKLSFQWGEYKPTLAIFGSKKRRNENFVPLPYWEIFAEFSSPAGSYLGKWEERGPGLGKKAQSIIDKVKGQEGEVAEYKDVRLRPHPLLYNLTELQRDANKLFGYSAKRTLDSAQRLYERHKLITYPRTDSRYLSPDLISQVEECWHMLAECGFAEWVNRDLSPKKVLKDKRVFDESKVSDHHAIIPTGENRLGKVSKMMKSYGLIVKRFIASFYPEAVWVHRSIKTVVG